MNINPTTINADLPSEGLSPRTDGRPTKEKLSGKDIRQRCAASRHDISATDDIVRFRPHCWTVFGVRTLVGHQAFTPRDVRRRARKYWEKRTHAKLEHRFEKSLYDLIRGLRNHKGNEREYIQNCLKECRAEIRGADMGRCLAPMSSVEMTLRGKATWARRHMILTPSR